MYAFQVVPYIKSLTNIVGGDEAKAVDAILYVQAKKAVILANNVINQQEEILRRFHTMHQGDNMSYGDSEDERGQED